MIVVIFFLPVNVSDSYQNHIMQNFLLAACQSRQRGIYTELQEARARMLCILLLGIASLAYTKSVFDYTVKDAHGNEFSLEQYRGYVLLIVNVASYCRYVDDNYESLVPLQAKYAKDNFTVLAFPCNQFGQQEFSSDADIQKFVQSHFEVNFPVLAKVNVLRGDNQSNLWRFLEEEASAPQWNYWKYLIGRDGRLMEYWHHGERVRSLENDIKNALNSN
ncbi:hypothetical protein ACOME3_004758 [Neoechinorhynchus agilis]